MNSNTVTLAAAALGFAALTAWAVWEQGLVAIFTWLAGRPGGVLLMVDLAIALSLAMVWMWHDARRRGRSATPYLVLTLCTGSLGPLVYLVFRERDAARR